METFIDVTGSLRRSRPHFLWKMERHLKDRALAAFVSARRTHSLLQRAILVQKKFAGTLNHSLLSTD